jgi:hypothetical protein
MLAVGAVLTFVCNAALPRPDNPAVVSDVLTTLGESDARVRALSLGVVAGTWLILGGIAGLYRSVTHEKAVIWMRMGFHFSVLSVGVWTVTFGLLIAVAGAAAEWMLAPGTEESARLSVAETLTVAFSSLYTIAIAAQSVTFVVVGLGLTLSPIHGKWLGLVGFALGILTLGAVGIPRVAAGSSEASQLMFLGLSLLSLLWLFTLGIWLLTQHAYSDRQGDSHL